MPRAVVAHGRRGGEAPHPLRRAVRIAAALAVLHAALTFENAWPTFLVVPSAAPSVEAAALVAGLAVLAAVGRLPGPRGVSAIAIGVTLLVVLRYASVTTAGLYGRPVHLYFDLPHVPNVAAMLAKVASPPRLALFAAAALGLVVAVLAVSRLAVRVVVDGVARPAERSALGVAAIAALAVYALGGADARRSFAEPAVAAAWTQVERAVSAHRAVRDGTLLPPAEPLGDGPLPGLRGADVIVVFVESYGAVALDRRDIAAEIAGARAALERAIAATGRSVVSGRVRSPTFAGASWLAHASFLAGIRVDHGGAYAALLGGSPDTLARRFRRAGYRTVSLMPGLREPWPEGAALGFDVLYDARAIAWRGPEFGWWRIPDQYSLARLDALERGRADRPPLFALVATVSTHVPFRPTPPYQPDWERLASDRPFAGDDLAPRLSARPDWLDLAPAYAESLRYALRTLAGYVERWPDDDAVLIVLGDHQPAASIAGPDASWDVPIHVIARPEALIGLERQGLVAGLTPDPSPVVPMERLAVILLDAFAGRGGREAAGRASH